MLGDIIKKEILENLLSHKFLFVFILCSVLILFSVYIGAADYVESKRQHDANLAALAERMQPPTTGEFFLEWEGYRIYRPPQILRTVVAGVEDVAGRGSNPNKQHETSLTESKNLSNTILVLFGSLDIMFAVKFILSLFAIFFAYDAVSGEKEKGTLKLMLSNNLSRSRLISGKIIGNYICMLLLFLTPLLMGIILLSIFPGISLSEGDWTRLFFIFIMFLLYISVFFALGIFVSALTTRSSTSFLILLFLWIGLVIIIPGIAVIVAGHVRPVPSSSFLVARKSQFRSENQSSVIAEYSVKSKELTARLQQRQAELQPLRQEDPRRYQEEMAKLMEESSKLSLARDQEINDKVGAYNAQIDRDYQLKKDAQQSLAKNLSRISPASAMTFGSMALARTGTDEYDRFLSATRDFRRLFVDWVSNLRGMNARVIAMPIDDSVTSTMPQFRFEPERLGESLNRTLPDFALMAAMTILLLAGAYFAFLRYDVR